METWKPSIFSGFCHLLLVFREGTSHLSMDWFGPARREVLLDETLLDAALSPSGKMQALDALAEIKRLTMQLG